MAKPRQASLNHTLAGAPPTVHPKLNSSDSDSKFSSSSSSSSNHSSSGSGCVHLRISFAGEDEHDRANALLDLAIGLIESALDILHNHLTSDEQMIRQSFLMPGGTLGKHFRHVIETYQAFLRPLVRKTSSTSSTSLMPPSTAPHMPHIHSDLLVINYDAILPSTRRLIARSRSACEAAMMQVRDGLVAWGQRCGAGAGSGLGSGASEGGSPRNGLRSNVGRRNGLANEFERRVELVAITPTRQELRSSIGRELWFCSLHAIHHFSMLRTIAVHELGLKLPLEFGTAPSTLLYRGSDWRSPMDLTKRVKAKL